MYWLPPLGNAATFVPVIRALGFGSGYQLCSTDVCTLARAIAPPVLGSEIATVSVSSACMTAMSVRNREAATTRVGIASGSFPGHLVQGECPLSSRGCSVNNK